TSLGIGVGGIGGWLAVVVVVMMDGVIVDLGEGIEVTIDEPVVKMDSIPGSIIGFNRSSFFKAFLVTADVPEIYMQEFWATAKVHQHFIRFKMDTKKHIVNLESFREMLDISPRVLGQSFAELPFEEEILEFLRFL
nr:hypothetical protein [Tanacetum cinerariifolium]